MSSFRRKPSTSTAPRNSNASGVRVSHLNSQVSLISTGIPSLDDIFGGGLQLGTATLVLNPDPHSSHATLVQKYCISQGISSGHQIHIFDPDAEDLVASCMWKADGEPSPLPAQQHSNEDDDPVPEKDKVKIAWRYERMEKFKTTVSSASSLNDNFCEAFDLSHKIPSAVVDRAVEVGLIAYHNPDEFDFEAAISRLKQILANTYDRVPKKVETVTRLLFPSLGGPSWGDSSPQDTIRFLVSLRAILRKYPRACAILSLPPHLSRLAQTDTSWMDKLGWVADACISLEAASADPSTAVVLPSHHGLLRIISLPRVQMLVPGSDRTSSLRGISTSTSSSNMGGLGENNLAFKCTRRRLLFETFHLDVEGGVGERRTTPSTTSSTLASSIPSSLHEPVTSLDGRASVTIKVEVDRTEPVNALHDDYITSQKEATPVIEETATQKKKKIRKKVGFQTEKPDIYDF